LVQINILKDKGLNLQAEPPHIKPYWIARWGKYFRFFVNILLFLVSRSPTNLSCSLPLTQSGTVPCIYGPRLYAMVMRQHTSALILKKFVWFLFWTFLLQCNILNILILKRRVQFDLRTFALIVLRILTAHAIQVAMSWHVMH